MALQLYHRSKRRLQQGKVGNNLQNNVVKSIEDQIAPQNIVGIVCQRFTLIGQGSFYKSQSCIVNPLQATSSLAVCARSDSTIVAAYKEIYKALLLQPSWSQCQRLVSCAYVALLCFTMD